MPTETPLIYPPPPIKEFGRGNHITRVEWVLRNGVAIYTGLSGATELHDLDYRRIEQLAAAVRVSKYEIEQPGHYNQHILLNDRQLTQLKSLYRVQPCQPAPV